ncbi:MAG: thiol-disulfide isomerase/thioredoxin [Sulfurimonas sp.]|jgi:thiol-disulfide isomerase/thioredoxin|uniref:redoxin family protein n=1 Tax=Sulfurimonas sp. TaxID=2022749 RepID=UPI0039E21C9D
MLKRSLFIALISVAIVFQACGNKENNKENETVNAMVSANEYVLTATDAKTQYIVKKEAAGFTLENAKGKVIIFDIFATWCPPCQASAIHLSSLQKKFKDDLVVIGVTIEDGISNADLEDFKSKFHAEYTIVNSDQNRRLVNEVATSLKLGDRFPIPIMAMYKDGKLITHYIGEVQEEFVESDIKRALGK